MINPEGVPINLYLVQHAESKPKEEDPQRSLSDLGKTDVEKVAAFVSEHTTLKIDRILHSGKTRARQTAEVLAKYLNPQDGIFVAEDMEPMADPSIWTNRLAEEKEDLMLVGHLPHLDKLAAKLVCGDTSKSVVAFQNSGVVCLAKDDSGVWSLYWMVTPRMLK
jgi:phosphohistidine phosphatase